MCFFITIAVPARNADLVPQVFGRDFRTDPTANPAIAAALPTGYALMLLTSGMCSCSLYSVPLSDAQPDPEDHLRRKYAKRGWSDAKIARAVEQAKQSGTKNLHVRGLRPDVVTRLQELCQTAGKVAVIVHWYGGDIEAEQFVPTRAEPCECAELPARAAQLREDELLVVAARRGAWAGTVA